MKRYDKASLSAGAIGRKDADKLVKLGNIFYEKRGNTWYVIGDNNALFGDTEGSVVTDTPLLQELMNYDSARKDSSSIGTGQVLITYNGYDGAKVVMGFVKGEGWYVDFYYKGWNDRILRGAEKDTARRVFEDSERKIRDEQRLEYEDSARKDGLSASSRTGGRRMDSKKA